MNKPGNLVVGLADKYNPAIVLENPKRVRKNAKKSRSFNKKPSPWFYRRI